MRLMPALLIFCGLIVTGCEEAPTEQSTNEPSANDSLRAHSAEFKKGVVQVADNVHVAIGYGLANSILIEGTDGVIVVDTTESVGVARKVKAEFDKITDKPVKAIIYTHNHADHVLGSGVFVGDDNPEIYSYVTTPEHIDKILQVIRPIIYKRSMRQFGTFLPKEARVNAGISLFLDQGPDTLVDLRRPTKTFSGEMTEIEVAGVKMELHFAPGETPDQIFVWLPDQKILLPGDNYYHSFPNLYAIRGTSYRDVMDWVRSLDKMRALKPEILVPSHTRPVVGQERIYQNLTDYRDAIQYIHDQTVKAMNDGLDLREIVEKVKLPPHLAQKPYLQEFYGRVDWSVRSVFTGYLGWFGGNATDLEALPKRTEADNMANLAGGVETLRANAVQAFDNGQLQWALQLTDYLLVLDPEDEVAAETRIKALTSLAKVQISANSRNYYLTQALEQNGLKMAEPNPAMIPDGMLASFPISQYMHAMRVSLDAEKSADVETTIGFDFTDTGEKFGILVRKGVAEVVNEFPENPDATLRTETFVWKEILARRRNAAIAFASGDVEIDGSIIDMLAFLSLFQPPEN
ncbi:MAG: MBL fold metallo-hydrolase [Proteobacteria bacterium]|nr:MBL fold metallo-hydrolase [Pseudomonadota bacterium]